MLANFWFILVAVLFIGYFVLEGFDFGVGMLMPFLGRTHTGGDDRVAASDEAADPDKRRRVLLNTIGPVWDGNEVWLLTAGGALFAAFGGWYATMFTAFYLPLFIILIGLITRVVAIEWRGKINDPKWRQWCDIGIGLGSWIPAILWGVAFATWSVVCRSTPTTSTPPGSSTCSTRTRSSVGSPRCWCSSPTARSSWASRPVVCCSRTR